MRNQYFTTWLFSRHYQFQIFKYTVYTLLTMNIYFFSIHGTLAETAETAAWIVILALFEWETRRMGQPLLRWEKRIIVIFSTLSYGVIVLSCYTYFKSHEWLDFINALTWIFVVIVLEYELLIPNNASSLFFLFRNAMKGILYTILLLCIILWGVRGDTLDFYDAFLWFISFCVIELNIFKFEHHRQSV